MLSRFGGGFQAVSGGRRRESASSATGVTAVFEVAEPGAGFVVNRRMAVRFDYL
jgi:hypothetical protein